MAARLLTFERVQPLPLGKPKLPVLNRGTKLIDLIGSRSWAIFNILEICGSFLWKPTKDWDTDEEYIHYSRYVRNLKVVNDMSERAIRVCALFLNGLTQDPEQKTQMFRVIEDYRQSQAEEPRMVSLVEILRSNFGSL